METKEKSMATDCRTHFDSQAQLWEQKFERGGSMSQRPAMFVRVLQQVLGASGRVLDFGCGPGDITITCRNAGFEMCGVDSSQPMIDRARWRSRGLDIEFQCLQPAERICLPYADGCFDAVIASSVFEYIGNPPDFLRELQRICVPGGWLIFTVPNLLHPLRWAESALRGVLVPGRFELSGSWERYAQYLHVSVTRFPQDQWRRLLQASGWRLEEVQGHAQLLRMLIAQKTSQVWALR
jgi:SAM-dependent methyltransferase